MKAFTLTAFLCLLCAPAFPIATDTVTIAKSDSFVTEQDTRAGIEKSGNGQGAVRMSHEAHAKGKVRCVTCHHRKDNDDRIKQCARCHKGAPAQDRMHGACITCHEKTKKGPADCEQCHKP